jgi:hypothetical protein
MSTTEPRRANRVAGPKSIGVIPNGGWCVILGSQDQTWRIVERLDRGETTYETA